MHFYVACSNKVGAKSNTVFIKSGSIICAGYVIEKESLTACGTELAATTGQRFSILSLPFFYPNYYWILPFAIMLFI
jgi:hypothetical protein